MNVNCIAECNAPMTLLDACGHSETLQCVACHRCYLVTSGAGRQVSIPLRDFHLNRGEHADQRPLADLAMAERLVEELRADRWPSAATVIDYGIESPRHLGALQHAIACGVTAYELDRVLGDGAAITALVQSAPHQPYGHVDFDTAYDSSEWEVDFIES
jgi:hypothetical protein